MYSEIENSSTFDRKCLVLYKDTYKIALKNYLQNITRAKLVKLKRWNRGLLALVALLLVLGIIVVVNIIIKQYSTEKMQFGSLSDWVSAIANIIMSIAAAYAAISWLKQKKITSNVELAHSTLVEHEKNLWLLYNLCYELSLSLGGYEHWFRTYKDTADHSETKTKILNELDNYPVNELKNKSDLYVFLGKSKRYGIIISKEFNNLQEKILYLYGEHNFNYTACLDYIYQHEESASNNYLELRKKFDETQLELAHCFEKELGNMTFEETYTIKNN